VPATDERSGRAGTLVLGVGNILYRDEGVGVAAAAALALREYPGVDVLDGGTLGLSLFSEVEGRDSLLIFDAVQASGQRPGTILAFGPEVVCKGLQLCLSAHQLGVPELLATAGLAGQAPRRVLAVTMVPASLELGYGLTPVAESALAGMVARGVSALTEWGVIDHA
jgi:hydrogenase maturation protease